MCECDDVLNVIYKAVVIAKVEGSSCNPCGRPCGDPYWVFWGDHYSVVSDLYAIEGVTAMPLGLHARLCHAFLVTKIQFRMSIFTCSNDI